MCIRDSYGRIPDGGTWQVLDTITRGISNTSITEIFNESIGITEYSLSQNYPNPFNPSTKISWQSPIDGQQSLKVYDVLGNEIVTLVDEYKPAGSYEVIFDATNLSSGMYFYRLDAQNISQVRKMIFIK